MRGGHLNSNASLALGNHGVGKADDVDPVAEQALRHVDRELCIAEHHRNDRVSALVSRPRDPDCSRHRLA